LNYFEEFNDFEQNNQFLTEIYFMEKLKIGIANSVSSNFNFDPFDTIEYALQSAFPIVQIYLSRELLNNKDNLSRLLTQLSPFEKVYFHAEGLLNPDFAKSKYFQELIEFITQWRSPNLLIHFDETVELSTILKILGAIQKLNVITFLENYFQNKNKDDAEKNLKKYLAVFTLFLAGNHGKLFPVLDIPRIFHADLNFTESEALEWSFQLINYFDNRHIPITLHLIDAHNNSQHRTDFCPLGEGYIPFEALFQFVKKNHPPIEAIIFEYEDKISPLKSRDFLKKILNGWIYE